MPLVRSAIVLLTVGLSARTATAQHQDVSSLRIHLASAADGRPLSGAWVIVDGQAPPKSTIDDGSTSLSVTRDAKLQVHLRHIGFVPKDTVMVIDSPSMTLKIEMARAVARLETLNVVDDSSCSRPGWRRFIGFGSPALSTVMEQLEENAIQARFLMDAFPYGYAFERRTTRVRTGTSRETAIDTATTSSAARLPYRTGHVVDTTAGHGGDMARIVHLPTLADFASPEFQATHCFAFVRQVEVLGRASIEIGFRPLDSLSARDAAGSVFLDSASYQVREVTARLTVNGLPLDGIAITAASQEVYFMEVDPSVYLPDWVVSRISNESKEHPSQTILEERRVLRFGRRVETHDATSSGPAAPKQQPTSSPITSQVQRRTVSVRVRDETNRAVSGADVMFVQGAGGAFVAGRTDTTGTYQLLDADSLPLPVSVVARKLGYAPTRATLSDVRADGADVLLTLRPTAALDTIRINATMRGKNYVLGKAEILGSTRTIRDALEALEKLRPEMLGDQGRCPSDPVTNVWINGRRVFFKVSSAAPARMRKRGAYRVSADPRQSGGELAVQKVLASIKPEHLSEIRYVNCWDITTAGIGTNNAIYITLLPGFTWDMSRGSHVAP